MFIADFESCSEIYGPGKRVVIWTQGCSIRCDGCWNSRMWEFGQGKYYDVVSLILQIKSVGESIEGITILGGEPFDQFEELYQLSVLIKKSGLTLMLYTGYELEELYDKGYDKIMQHCDILIHGRYKKELRNINKAWIGSDNQKILFISKTYKNYTVQDGNYIEMIIEEDGDITISGYPDIIKDLLNT